MKALVLFGSKSDESIYGLLVDRLCSVLDVEFHVISAHRDPDKLAEVLKTSDYHVAIGGAGLAAHLPGVIASKISKPVMGIPVAGNFAGLDSLLSIMQMPYGVPVLSSAPDDIMAIVDFLKNIKKGFFDSINVVIKQNALNYEYVSNELKRLEKLCGEHNIKANISFKTDSEACNIVYMMTVDDIKKSPNAPCIHVPILPPDRKNIATEAINFFEIIKLSSANAVWTGVNNSRNALLSYLKFKEVLR